MNQPVSVLDVAQYILKQIGRMTTWKLQKLCYYSQAWSLVWGDGQPLFREKIEAWANGPVILGLYEKHRGHFEVSRILGGHPDELDVDQSETVDAVLKVYGDKTSSWLIQLTHSEAPWRNARKREHLGIGERGNAEILLDDMAEYYGGLYAQQED